jgi:hypothetical protein
MGAGTGPAATGELRALRPAPAQETAAGDSIYGWFSTATPSAMARCSRRMAAAAMLT